MEISAVQVKELRDATGLGMMLCKKALMESGGDMGKAIETLRKQGQATAQKRAGKAAKEGKIAIILEKSRALMYEVNSETDFVARNADFVAFVGDLGKLLIAANPPDLNAALALTFPPPDGRTVADRLTEIIGKIGENISLRRFDIISFDPARQRVFSYLHHNGKIGVLLLTSAKNSDALACEAIEELGKDLTLQVTAANPIAVKRTAIAESIIAKEKEIYFAQAQSSGRPENVWNKIVDGKMNKFFKDSALVEQEYIRDSSMSITDRIKQAEAKAGCTIEIDSFIRYELGAEK